MLGRAHAPMLAPARPNGSRATSDAVTALERHGDAELGGRAGGALGAHGRPGRAPGALNAERAGRRTLGLRPNAWRSDASQASVFPPAPRSAPQAPVRAGHGRPARRPPGRPVPRLPDDPSAAPSEVGRYPFGRMVVFGAMSPTEHDGALIITFPRLWTAAQRLAFMEDVGRRAPRALGARGRVDGYGQHRGDGRRAPGGLRAVDGPTRAAGGWAGCGVRAHVDGMNATPPLEHGALTPVS